MTDPLREAAATINRDGVGPLDIIQRLHKETPHDEIRHRPGPHSKHCVKPCQVAHTPLAYVDARYVMDTLDEAVGPDNWQRTHVMGAEGKVICCIAIRIDGVWIEKCDGAGETDIEPEKGSFSDSFKRAAVSWGIARDLYDKDTPSVPPIPPQYRPQAVPAPQTDLSADEVDRDPRGFDDGRPDHYTDAVPRSAGPGGVCPAGHGPWVLKPGGYSKNKVDADGKPAWYDPFYACPSRERPFCKEKPSKAWLARQETN